MKSIKIFSPILYLSLFFLIASCDLSEYNPSGLTADAVYTTPEGFETLVNAAYSYQREWYGKEEGNSAAEIGTDLWSGTENKAEAGGLNRYQNLNSSDPYLESLWQALYAGINMCNAGIERIGNSGLSTDLQAIREGELRFLRAFYNWHIVETWGGVHLTTEETTGIVVTANRSSVEDFYNQIFLDLDIAVANLPVTTSDLGRVTKPAAEAFLARMHLYRGNDQEAHDLAKGVIDKYNFRLLENFADLWPMENNENDEIVYYVNYPSEFINNRSGNLSQRWYSMTYDQLPGMTRSIFYQQPSHQNMPTLFLLDLYNEEIDSRYYSSFREVWYANNDTGPMAIGDTAIVATKQVLPPEFREGKVYSIWDRWDYYNPDFTIVNQNRFPSLKKFDDPTRSAASQTPSSRDVFVIRLAEMYFIAAEAQHNLGNNSDVNGAAYYINVIRERAAYPGQELAMQISESDINIDFILDEKAREFAGEQIRWFDLKRTGKLQERIELHSPLKTQYFQPYHVLRPIPQIQLDAVENPEEFQQNPGYH